MNNACITAIVDHRPKERHFDLSAELETGIPTIDDQHRKLMERLGALDRAIAARCSREILCEYLAEFADLAIKHFESEEQVMRQMGYVGLSEHCREHEALVGELESFAEHFARDGNLPFSAVFDFLYDWVVNHLAVMDRQYVEYLAQGASVTGIR